MDYNIHKICRICLEEGALTSIFSTEFAMMPSTMIMMCAKIRIYKSDGLPAVICNNCIYRLGVAYHFKQECENSDIRLRQYLGLNDRGYYLCDAQTNTEDTGSQTNAKLKQKYLGVVEDSSEDEEANKNILLNVRKKRRSRYQPKPADQHKKRGPKPLPKLPQTCYECQKSFKCAAQLQMHMRTHTGEKPYACQYCARRFAQKYNLRIHERTHTGERPFQCEICSKQFSALGNFQAHQKIHTGLRDQICPVCQKAFYSAGDLTKHMVTHTGLKPHACHVCGKNFSRMRDMLAHKRKLHGENIANVQQQQQQQQGQQPTDDGTDDEVAVQEGVNDATVALNVSDCFKCPDCNKEFDNAGSLSLHFRTHAGGMLNLPPPHAHPHHTHYTTPTPMHHMHDGLHHTHHLGSLNTPALQTATNMSGTGVMPMSMSHHHHHATMSHMLQHPPPPPHAIPTHAPHMGAPTATTPAIHTQRLHQY